MEYRGYVGSVERSPEDSLFFGRVQGIRSLISYEGSTATELADDFHHSFDDYLAMCEAEGITPERSCIIRPPHGLGLRGGRMAGRTAMPFDQ